MMVMTNTTGLSTKGFTEQDSGVATISRRKFLNFAGATTGVALLATACKKNSSSGGVDLGSGDTGILNYAYALEQLEAAFYIKVASSFYANATTNEKAILTRIRDHEVAHREFLKNALGSSAIQNLEVDFSSVNFADRTSVLSTSKAFEDLGVSAYNGAGQFFQSSAYLVLAGKIVSVEARHAAAIRDLITPDSFVGPDVVDVTTGMEMSKSPSAVLSIASAFIKTKINASNLPS
jgi:rubrerythrin